MYKLYCNDYLPCVYCHKHVSLYNAKAHLKTKQCKNLQNQMSEEEKSSLLIRHTREVNKLKCELRLKERPETHIDISPSVIA